MVLLSWFITNLLPESSQGAGRQAKERAVKTGVTEGMLSCWEVGRQADDRVCESNLPCVLVPEW